MSKANFVDPETNMTDEQKEAKIKSKTILINVQEPMGRVLQYKINRYQTLSKLMNDYCNRAGRDITMTRFLYLAERVKQRDTPRALEMEEGDTIEIYYAQCG